MEIELAGRRPGHLGFPLVVYAKEGGTGAGSDGERLRVLVVEDDYLAASDAEASLIDAGFEVVGIAASAEEATRLAKAERPNLAIMDIRLAGHRDGVDAAIELYRDLGLRSIFATAHHDDNIRMRARPAEPLGWLAKPYTEAALISIVTAALSELGKSK